MGGEGIIQGEGDSSGEKADDEKRQDEAGHTHASGQHRDDLVRARHAAERKEEGQEERHREQNHQHLRDLGPVKAQDQAQRRPFIEDGRAVIADVENEPDGEETKDAINEGLEEIPEDVAVEKSHWGKFESRISNVETSPTDE